MIDRDTITHTIHRLLERESMLSRFRVVLVVLPLTLFALHFSRLGCRFLFLRLRHDLAAATASHFDVVQRPPGLAHVVAGNRGNVMFYDALDLSVLVPSVFLSSFFFFTFSLNKNYRLNKIS